MTMRSFTLAVLTAAAIAAPPTSAMAQSGAPKIPIVDIHAPNGIVDDPKRGATMRVLDSQRRENYSGRIGIEVRGLPISAGDPKKPYAIETRKQSGKNRDVSLLGMPADDDWALIASYVDESLLRNFVAYSTSIWLGRYAPRARLVELFVNDSTRASTCWPRTSSSTTIGSRSTTARSRAATCSRRSAREGSAEAVFHDTCEEEADRVGGPEPRRSLIRRADLDPQLRQPVRGAL